MKAEAERLFQLAQEAYVRSSNPKISVILANYLTSIRYIDWLLLFDSESYFLKFDSQRVLINFFQKTEAELVMNCVGATDDCLSEFVVRRPSLFSSVRC